MSLKDQVEKSIRRHVIKKTDERYLRAKEKYGYDLEGQLASDEGEKMVLCEMKVASFDEKGIFQVIIDSSLEYNFRQVEDLIEEWRNDQEIEKLGRLGIKK